LGAKLRLSEKDSGPKRNPEATIQADRGGEGGKMARRKKKPKSFKLKSQTCIRANWKRGKKGWHATSKQCFRNY